MANRRLRRKQEKTQRHAPPVRRAATGVPAARAPAAQRVEPAVVVLEATRVERLAYTRSQAAAALGISRSTFIRHVLPYVETIEIGSGSRLIPVNELERYAADRRRPARAARADRPQSGRPAVLTDDLVAELRARCDAGESLAQIARELNAAGTPTAHGGARWWPSTVRAVLERVSPPQQKRT
jgi:predicted DNA-binding protein (UPF0251 family)